MKAFLYSILGGVLAAVLVIGYLEFRRPNDSQPVATISQSASHESAQRVTATVSRDSEDTELAHDFADKNAGYLTAKTVPSSDLFLITKDGERHIASTPFTNRRMSVGKYKGRFVNRMLKMNAVQEFEVVAGQTTNLEVKLESQ